jgi:tryptophan synthase alpha chain
MSRIEEAFRRAEGRSALIAYVTAGFPDFEVSLRIASALLEHCDILELGVPFSDPVMDGPVIQESSRRALQNGATVDGVMNMARELRSASDKPLLIMTYYNPVHRRGDQVFAAGAAEAGIDGVLIPDLPPEEMSHWSQAADEAGLDTVLFASPTTPPQRLRLLGEQTRGFLYCIAVRGTTGLRDSLSDELGAFMKRVRSCCKTPLALGIGISNPEQCRVAASLADAVVVGSALVKCTIDALDEGEDPALRSADLAKLLKEAVSTSENP